MKQPILIQRMIQKVKKRQLNKPIYKIEDLYVGEIIFIVDMQFIKGPTFWQNGTMNTYKPIKPFAIFYHKDCGSNIENDYRHIITGHSFRLLSPCSEIGEYVVNSDSIKDFDKIMQRYMIENNLKKTSKLSTNDIKELEDYINQKLYPEQEKDELFC